MHLNTRLPLWLRVSYYAADNHARLLERGELRTAIDPDVSPTEISRAIRRGIQYGLLDHHSTARCLYARSQR